MEKYYIVPEGTSLHTEYFKYKENLAFVNAVVKEFILSHGIETTEYWCSTSQFAIIPTEKDVKSFGHLLRKEKDENGLRLFRKDSFINKEWASKSIKVFRRPQVMFSFSGYGNGSSRLFDADGVLYCSHQSKYDFKCLEEFKEIKASEFFKVLEDSQKM